MINIQSRVVWLAVTDRIALNVLVGAPGNAGLSMVSTNSRSGVSAGEGVGGGSAGGNL